MYVVKEETATELLFRVDDLLNVARNFAMFELRRDLNVPQRQTFG